MGKLVKKGGKFLKKDGKFVTTDNPANCPCCGEPPPEPNCFFCNSSFPDNIQPDNKPPEECLDQGGFLTLEEAQDACGPPPPPPCEDITCTAWEPSQDEDGKDCCKRQCCKAELKPDINGDLTCTCIEDQYEEISYDLTLCGGGDGGGCPPGKFCTWTPPDPCSTGKCTSSVSDTPVECPEGFPYDCTSEEACNQWYEQNPNPPCDCWFCEDGEWVNKPSLNCINEGGILGQKPPPEDCQPPPCESPYNVTVSTSITNVKLDPALESAAGSQAGDIAKLLEEALALNPPTFTRWCCLPEPTGCSLGDSIDGGLSEFDGVEQEANTQITTSGNLDAPIGVSTSSYFFNGYHALSGFKPVPEGEAGVTGAGVISFNFNSSPAQNPPMTLRTICNGTKDFTFSNNSIITGTISINYRYWDAEEGNWMTGGTEGIYRGDTTYTVNWDYGGPPNQRKKLIEQENPLP